MSRIDANRTRRSLADVEEQPPRNRKIRPYGRIRGGPRDQCVIAAAIQTFDIHARLNLACHHSKKKRSADEASS
jgi:hypothetical protein